MLDDVTILFFFANYVHTYSALRVHTNCVFYWSASPFGLCLGT